MKRLKFKHLSFEDRVFIQARLNLGSSFVSIGKGIGKDRTTISKEVRRGRYVLSGDTNAEECPLTKKPPYVCNGCEKIQLRN